MSARKTGVRSWIRTFFTGRQSQQKSRELEEMQRCPYLHEMKERLLSQPTPTDSLDMERLDGTGTPIKEHLHNDYPAHTNPGHIPDPPEMPPDSLIGTVVKLNSDGYGSHTSPAHARQPLVPQNANNPPFCFTPTHTGYNPSNRLPKNAKIIHHGAVIIMRTFNHRSLRHETFYKRYIMEMIPKYNSVPVQLNSNSTLVGVSS